MESIFGLSLNDLTEQLSLLGLRPFVAKQIYDWLYKKRIFAFESMTNIKKEIVPLLNEHFDTTLLHMKRKQESPLTNKYLFELADGSLIEAVLMRHDYGISVCVSSQVGCNMGCSFCESGRLKKIRDLKASEMVREILMIEEDIKRRISSVVIMGIGEPFDNYDEVMKFMKIINEPLGLAIGARHITVSTSGIIPKIRAYADEPMQTNLAISLHAPNNEIRNKIMKVNKAYPIEELITSIKEYIEKTNRRVTIEYLLLDGVNDTKECALELAQLLRGMNVYVNLIPYNETSHLEYKKSSKKSIDDFFDTLKKRGINVTIRKEFGGNIDAACGQLRANEVER